MPGDFENSRVLITGAGSGVGRAMSLGFAVAGADVFAVDLDEASCRETAAVISDDGGSCTPLVADVSVVSEVRAAVSAAGGIDVLINNTATWAGDGLLHEVAEDDWDHIVDVTLKSVYLCCREALPSMILRRSGAIISISSINALTGIHLAAYTAAKGGMISLTRLLALQYGRYGIRSNVICPGTIMTPNSVAYYAEHPDIAEDLRRLVPGGRLGEPADIVECAMFLASDRASFINGSVMVVDGGASAIHRIEALYPT